MELLKVVNYCLKYLGENRVSSVDTRHPTVNDVVLETDDQVVRLLSKGWWFNERTQKYYPDTEGKIAVPVDCIMVLGSDVAVDTINGYFWNTATDTNVFGGAITATIRHKLSFEQLPEVAAEYVKQHTCITLYTQEYGVENTVQILLQKAQEAEMLLNREQLRQKKYNSTKALPYGRVANAMRT